MPQRVVSRFIIVAIFAFHSVLACAQVPLHLLKRTLLIQTASVQGTAFTIELDGKQYLITAKHVAAGLKDEDVISVNQGNKWNEVKVKVFRCADSADIAVLVADRQLTASFPLDPSGLDGLMPGQDAYFVGFPFGLASAAKFPNRTFPIPFIKKGTLAASGDIDGAPVVFLDGNNNYGFSGGPIVAWKGSEMKLIGIVSGFRHDFSHVFSKEEITPSEVTPDDKESALLMNDGKHLYRLHKTDKVVEYNTGIVVGYILDPAIELIKKHPVGPTVDQAFK